MENRRDVKSESCWVGKCLVVTFRRFSSVAKFGTLYFLLKIKILAKRERELTTKIRNCEKRLLYDGFILKLEHANFASFHFGFQFPISIFYLFSEEVFKVKHFQTYVLSSFSANTFQLLLRLSFSQHLVLLFE